MSEVQDQAYQIREQLAGLEQALLDKTPNMPVLLRTIHNTLKKDPDIVTILTDVECSILVKGLKAQTATEISVALVKSKPKKSLSSMTIADL